MIWKKIKSAWPKIKFPENKRVASKAQLVFIVKKFLKPEKTDINWPNEVRIAKELFAKFPRFEFWEWYELSFYLNSLAFFKKKTNMLSLEEAYTKYMKFNNFFQQPIDFKLGEKIGNDKEVQLKPKTLKDFIQN